jgi:pSer/pThr/pTyr-binding forkhead associated (FHA) protein
MKIVLKSKDGEIVEFELGLGTNLIGRWDPDTKSFPEIDLEDFDLDSLVSRRHAQLIVKDEGVLLEDLGSKNGTFLLGGMKVEPGHAAEIAVGSEFLVGNVRLKLES